MGDHWRCTYEGTQGIGQSPYRAWESWCWMMSAVPRSKHPPTPFYFLNPIRVTPPIPDKYIEAYLDRIANPAVIIRPDGGMEFA